jgi:3-oxoacyl-[acyl-carrier protein] reductase
MAGLDRSHGQTHQIVCADMSDNKALAQVVEDLTARETIHILVNNSGGPNPGPAHKANSDEFSLAFNQHLLSGQTLVTACFPGMQQTGYGRIINIISTSVKQPLDNLGVSNTIRGAVANWAKTLANELGAFGITVNNVLPGATHTSRLEGIIHNNAAKKGISEAEIEAEMVKEIPLRRIGQATEVAAAVAFLASPAAAYINGINLPVDGGRTKNL